MVRIEVPAIRRRGALGSASRALDDAHHTHRPRRRPDLRLRRPRTHRRPGNARLALPPAGRALQGFGAIAIGHAIIVEPAFLERYGPWLLAHELAHTLQHDWLGPAYLPSHALSQLTSALIYAFRRRPGFSPWHTYNPLERIFICVPADAV